ncbi:tyrosine-type recombinase/integrase [Polaribacter atrinae]|uniref:tyrosine-type recombinase/integrase n=1 Tax=Polaribacter atrinae TaxID=1333662 RepID=UPI00248FB6D0|nr:site-specific integrase [Polaribacter atrinae]
MQSIYEFITFTSKIEHDLEHASKVLPLFSSPKIYTANGDLSKRWYVYFSFKDPETGKMKRMGNIYGKANNYKTKEARLTILTSYRKNLLFLLKKGFNPFVDNTLLHQKLKDPFLKETPKKKVKEQVVKEEGIPSYLNDAIKSAIKEAIEEQTIVLGGESGIGKTESIANKEKIISAGKQKEVVQKADLSPVTKNIAKQDKSIAEEEKSIAPGLNSEGLDENVAIAEDKEGGKGAAIQNKKIADDHKSIAEVEDDGISITKAFDLALELKEKEVSERTISDYRRKSNKFIAWMQTSYPDKKNVKSIARKDIIEYLNTILLRTSARSRNNYRTELGSLFQVLKDNELVDENYIQSIPILTSKPKRHKTYSLEEQKKIFKYLEKEDPHLLLFIKFVSYCFIRPIEVCRIKIKDINIEERRIQYKAKTSAKKTKIIPDILWEVLPDLSKLDKESYLFTPKAIGAFWDAKEINRRDHFSKRFTSVVKEQFGLTEDHGVYSFRHTFISKLYRKLREKATPFEAKSSLMLITGHTSMVSLEKYLRDIDAELPEDYSKLFE